MVPSKTLFNHHFNSKHSGHSIPNPQSTRSRTSPSLYTITTPALRYIIPAASNKKAITLRAPRTRARDSISRDPTHISPVPTSVIISTHLANLEPTVHRRQSGPPHLFLFPPPLKNFTASFNGLSLASVHREVLRLLKILAGEAKVSWSAVETMRNA